MLLLLSEVSLDFHLEGNGQNVDMFRSSYS